MAVKRILTDEDWELIKKKLPPRKRTGRPRKDERLVVEAILWILTSGEPWRKLPKQYGAWQTVYHVYNDWRKSGLLRRILRTLKSKSDRFADLDLKRLRLDAKRAGPRRRSVGGT